MGQFKPMVKMMTTEPSVILKLKKGGKVEKKADGGFMPMSSPMPAGLPARGGMAPAASPMKPSMAARRRAMKPTAKPAMNASLLMKKGGDASCETVEKELKAHKAKPASKAHKGMATGGIAKSTKPGGYATGGVINGQGGYKKGGEVAKNGIINTEDQGGEFRNTKMHTSKPNNNSAPTGGVKLGNGGGYKKGGEAKKAYAAGGTVDTGKPVAMPKKPVSKPIANSMQSGTFAKGGKVEKEEKPNLRLLKTHTGPKGDVAKVYKDKDWGEHRVKFFSPDGKHRSDSDYHTDDLSDAHDTAKSQLNRYKAGGNAKRYNAGGTTVDASKGAYDKSIGPSEEEMDMAKAIRSVPRKLYEGAKSMLNIGSSTPKPAGSVTKTEKSVTVTPANKKRGGRC